MKAVYFKELRSYFTSIMAYACYALIFLLAGLYVWGYNIQGSSGSFESTLSAMSLWVFVLSAPLLTMRVFTEERRQRTDQLLYSLPLKTTQVVFGKYLSAVTVLAVPTLVLALYPVILSNFGSVNFASSYSTLFAFYLMGAAFLAVGIFVSSLVENQIVAAIITAVFVFFDYYLPYIAESASQTAVSSVIFLAALGVILGLIVYFLTRNYFVALLTAAVLDFALVLCYIINSEIFAGLIPNLLSSISFFDRLEVFSGGVFDLTGIVFYLSVIFVFMFLTIQSVEKRRWS